MVTGSVDRTPRAPAPQTRNSKRWRIRVSIPVPRRCERRTLPIELIPHRSVTGVGFEPTPPKRLVPKTSALDHSAIQPLWTDHWLDLNAVRHYSTQLGVSECSGSMV